MQLLKVTSIQSPNADFFCRQVTQYLAAHLGVATKFVNDIPWPERERLLDAGRIQVGWICGLPYVWKADKPDPEIELLVAPVMAHPRYQDRPIYFSDVVVHQNSRFSSFADLRGASWAYNEPHSQSGYNVTRYHLAILDERSGYFGRVVEAGSHLRALDMVLDGSIDAAAIDSTVLELELAARPHLQDQMRIVEVLGPSPIPPWVVTSSLPFETRAALRAILLSMHQDPEGQTILAAGQVRRFAPVEDKDYDAIRDMERAAEQIALQVDPKQVVSDGYDRIAPEHDRWARQVRKEERAKYATALMEKLPAGAEILDLGCGAGVPTTRQLAARFALTGVDISARQVALARKNVPTARFIHADMTELDFEPASFDAVAAFYSLIHVPRQEQAGLLHKIASWLRPGGLLVATLGAHATEAGYEEDWLGAPMYWSSFDSQTNRELVEAAGLHIMQAQEERAEEFGQPVTFLWIVARKPGVG